MWRGTVITDANGIVLFDPDRLCDRYGGAIAEGTDLFTRFTTTAEGDAVLADGLIVPVLAIDDAGYDVVVRTAEEAFDPPGEIVAENGVFALRVRERLILADLAVLREWQDGTDWRAIPVVPGTYAVTVRGFRRLDRGAIVAAGYEVILERRVDLPAVTADTDRDMRVLRLDQDRVA